MLPMFLAVQLPAGMPKDTPTLKQQGERKKHHYIPVFYLKRWTGADGQLCEFSRPYKTPDAAQPPDIWSIPVKPIRRSPDATGYIKNLYTFPALSSDLANILENRFFLYVDNDAADVMQRLLAGDTNLDHRRKNAWARFLVSMFHRSPEGIHRVVSALNDGFPDNLEGFRPNYDAMKNDDDPPTFEKFLELFGDEHFQHMNLSTLLTVMDSQRVKRVINQMVWAVVSNVSERPLFTSDRPIFMTPLGDKNAHLVMPLTPWHLFMAAADVRTMENLDNRNRYGGLAEIVNNRVVRQARRYVYAVDDARIDFLRNRLGDRQPWSPLE